MRGRYWILYVFTLLFLLLFSQFALAQGDDSSCSALIEARFAELQQLCSPLEADSACYGSDILDMTLAASASSFSQPGDRVALSEVQLLQTGGLDPASESWGLAVMNSQATVPMAHEGSGLTLIMLGDVNLESLTSADDAMRMMEPIMVTALVAANVRDVPSLNSNVVASAAPGSEMPADALSQDQEWVRVLYEGRIAWVSRNLVAGTEPLSGLPVMRAGQRGLMQDFVVQTGSGLADCAGAVPSLLIVQGPQGIPVDIVANGAEIRISSTVAIWTTADNELRVMVLSGSAKIGNLNLPAGFTTKAQLSPDGRSIVGAWENVRPMTDGERQALMPLQGFPGALLSYVFEIPSESDIQQTLVALAQAGVQSGARTGPASGQADCSRFQPTSPLGGMGFDSDTFYWDAALGANNYRVNFYNEAGTQVGSFATNSENTALTIDVSPSSIGEGASFAWEVEALVNSDIACTTPRVTVLRDFSLQQTGGGGGGDSDNPGSGGGEWGS